MAEDSARPEEGAPEAPRPPVQQPYVAPQAPPPPPYAAPQAPPPPGYGAPLPQEPGRAPAQGQPTYPPVLMQLSGGMKFAWLVVGALLGIPGILVAWLVNVDRMPKVKDEALKFSIIGCVICIVICVFAAIVMVGAISVLVAGAVNSPDLGSYKPYGYGYGGGSW